jgi:ABC-type phosphonate transport system ATPase subunit
MSMNKYPVNPRIRTKLARRITGQNSGITRFLELIDSKDAFEKESKRRETLKSEWSSIRPALARNIGFLGIVPIKESLDSEGADNIAESILRTNMVGNVAVSLTVLKPIKLFKKDLKAVDSSLNEMSSAMYAKMILAKTLKQNSPWEKILIIPTRPTFQPIDIVGVARFIDRVETAKPDMNIAHIIITSSVAVDGIGMGIDSSSESAGRLYVLDQVNNDFCETRWQQVL